MKYSLNFIQVANWVYIIRKDLKTFRERLDKEKVPKEEAIELLARQKKHLKLIKEVLTRRTKLIGIQKDFLNNLAEIKKEFGIE